MGYRSGELAGPYEVLSLLGRGTFGEVLLCRDPRRPNHRVALKTVACNQLSPEAAERVRRAALDEARLLQQLRHPYIVQCEEVQWDAPRQTVWLALEYMNGGDVQELIEARRQAGRQPFDAHFMRRVLASVGSALEYVHAEGVLHRDVKPANILLTRSSHRIKLGDFGISRVLENSGCAHTVVGTPYYLSPEIVSGQAYGPASDAWALGVCLYELAALQRPFEAGNPLALVRRICEEPPADLPAHTPEDVRRAVEGFMQKDLSARLLVGQALRSSDAISALAAAAPEEVSGMLAASHRWPIPPSAPASPSPLSPVSMATTDESHPGSPADVVLLRSLAHQISQDPTAAAAAPAVAAVAAPEPTATEAERPVWPESVMQARAVLSADVDDPEELQHALRVLEQDERSAAGTCPQVFDSLRSELALRVAALRGEAAALLQSLLLPESAAQEKPSWINEHNEQTTLLLHNHGMVAEGTQRVVSPRLVEADTVTADSAGAHSGSNDKQAQNVAALESAMELATSLGMDTAPAEEEVAAARGLLSLRVVWGTFIRFFLVSLSVSFDKLMEEIACRFGLSAAIRQPGDGRLAARFPFELSCREGTECSPLRDKAGWEAMLRRRGLCTRPGRLELKLEVGPSMMPLLSPGRGSSGFAVGSRAPPFVVTGTRLSPDPKRAPAASPRLQPRPSTAVPAATAVRNCSTTARGSARALSVGRVRPRTQRRRSTAPTAPTWGQSAAGPLLQLKGHNALHRRSVSPGKAPQTPRCSARTRPRTGGA